MMKTPFQKLNPAASERMRDKSLTFWQAEFHTAQALAEHRLEAINDFCVRAQLWREEDVRALAVLTERAYAARQRLHHAYARLVREFLEVVKVTKAGEGDQ